MSGHYRLAGALQWGCIAYFLVGALGSVAGVFVDIGMSLSAEFSPLTLVWLAAILGGYDHVQRQKRSRGITRRDHARRVESLVGVLLFTTAGSVCFTATRVALRRFGHPLRLRVETFVLANAAITLVAVAAALVLAYVVDVRWLYGAEADPA